MTTELLSEIMGQKGMFRLLELIEGWELAFPKSQIFAAMENLGISDPDIAFEQMVTEGLVVGVGGNTMSLSTKGLKSLLLLQAVNGADVREVYRRLASLYPGWQQYEVVRDRMTQDFIRELYDRPDFHKLYLCSRWINLEKRTRGRFAQAVYWATEHNPIEIFVIHGPLNREAEQNVEMFRTLDFLKSLGAEIVLNKRVHAKLYIREPGASGGLQTAIVGSENLTIPKYAELGLKIINDSEMINKLTGVFFEIYAGQSY